jgi:hypothetical protein
MSRHIDIGIDTVFFERPYSGITKVWETLLSNLKPKNYKITLLVREKSQFIPKLDQFNIVKINSFNYALINKDVDYLNMVCKKLNLDYFISTYYTYCTIIPNIILIHDMIPELFNYNKNDPMWIQKDLAIKNASYFITVSDQTQKDLLKFYPYLANKKNNNYLKTIYNSIHFKTNIPNDSLLQQLNIKPKSYFFSVSTNNDDYKNSKLILECSKKYSNDLKILLKTNITTIVLTKNISRPTINDNILYISNIPEDILISLYKNALCTVIPSLYEGFCLPMFESMYYETPVIALQNNLFDELSPNAIHYINNDIESLFSKIKQISGNVNYKSKVENKIELGKNIVTRYNIETQIKEFTTFFDNLIHMDQKSFINIIIQTYNEKNIDRRKELEYCILQNLNNKYVNIIFDLGDDICLDTNIIQHSKFKRVSQKEWLTYKQAFNFANENSINGNYWCLLNLDIFLDYNSLWSLVKSYLNNNYSIALSRHEYNGDINKSIMDNNFSKLYHAHTQDAWLFKTPIKVENANFEFGLLGCDNAIADRLLNSGLQVINLPTTFKIYHNDIARGKTNENFLELHKTNSKIKNTHPERTGSYLIPNYDQLLDDNYNIDLNKVVEGLGISNLEKYKIICNLFTNKIKIQNPD